MAGQYVGVNNVARKVSSQYVGVNNVARQVSQGFIGVNNVARQFFSGVYLTNARNDIFHCWLNGSEGTVKADISDVSDGVIYTVQKLTYDSIECGTGIVVKFNGSTTIPAGTEIIISIETLERASYCNSFLIDCSGNNENANGGVWYCGDGDEWYSYAPSNLSDLNLTEFTFTKKYEGELKITMGFWNAASYNDKTSIKITKLVINGQSLI